jgi:biopolymer transport protein ExbB/TolQ
MEYSFVELLHTVGQWLAVPCHVILILLMAATVVQTGHVGVELFFEIRRHGRVNSVALVREMNGKSGEEKRALIENSGLFRREKKMLTDLLDTEHMEASLRQAIAQKLLAENEAYYGRILHITELVSKLGPMFGLLGTLIPLGPGIVALGVGDIQTLSRSMGMAFDTTIAGVISAAVCSVLSAMRRRWYTGNMGNMELLMEAIL